MAVTTDIYYKITGTTLDIVASPTSGYTKWTITNSYPPWHINKSSLTSIVVGRSNNKISPMYCNRFFFNCNLVTSIDLSGLDTSNVTSMDLMFGGCKTLTTLDLSDFDTSNVTDMDSMFSNCWALTELDLSGFDTSNVTDMGFMFDGCRSLSSLDLSGFDTSKVTKIYYMFSGCQALTTLTLSSSFDTSKVNTGMSYMFYDCRALTSLDLSGFDTSKVTNMSHMFEDCQALTTLTLPSSFDTSNVTNMSNMFNGCRALTTLDVSGFDTSNVTSMYYMFRECRALTTLDVSGFNTSNVTNMNSMFYNCRALTTLDVSGFNTSNVTDMNSMFYDCRVLTILDVSGFDTSKVISMSFMFYNCQSLTTLNMSPDFDTSNVISMSYMFGYCSALTSLNLSGFDTSNVTSMSSMFRDCRTLTTLDVSGFDTSNVTEMDNMFNYCRSLTTLDVSGFDISNLTSMSSMFKDCRALAIVYFPLYSHNNSVVIVDMFSGTKKTFLINKGTQTQTIIDFWKNIASQYTNVHYEFDDNSLPSVSNYSVLRVGSSGSRDYSDMGVYAYLKVTVSVYSDYLPPIYTNDLKSINLKVDNASETIIWTTQDTEFPKTYEGWYEIGETGYRHKFEVSSTDTIKQSSTEKGSRTAASLSFDLPKSVVLIDYYHDPITYEMVLVPDVADISTYYEYDPVTETYFQTEDQTIVSGKIYYIKLGTGEEGMSIGKYASHPNLLDVGFPTSFDESVVKPDMTPTEVSDFISELDISGSPIELTQADWVVEQGITGDWTWRKWQSGIAECWGNAITLPASTFSAWGNIYYHDYFSTATFPITFSATPSLQITSWESQVWVGSFWSTTTTNVGTVRMLGTSTTSKTPVINVYAQGRWK